MTADFIVVSGDSLCAVVDLGVYSRTALVKVAHLFTNRVYVHLMEEADNRITVRFRSKRDGVDCSPIVGEFMNALLDQTLRELIGQETEPVRNLILAHALSETTLIKPELETIDPLLDPNDVGTPDSKKLVANTVS